MRRVSILGATGSIGRQALDVVRRYPNRFEVAALVANQDAEGLFSLVREFHPAVAGLAVEPSELPKDVRFCEWFFGGDCAERVASMNGVDDVLSAIVGIAGLPAALAALKSADRLLLANKEALVTGGQLVMDEARKRGKPVIPVDSEHSAIFQCLQGAGNNAPGRIILTASGGPFRTWTKEAIASAQRGDALAHPTWKMGEKITVDCASMMNKGLEVIEAHHLFDMPLQQIEVVVHPESIVHSMVEFTDGNVIAQMGNPDMRAPIAYALGYPERIDGGVSRLDFVRLSLSFHPADTEKFPCLAYAYLAQRMGGNMPVALNAANEVAVAAFLRGEIPFGGIAELVECVLSATEVQPVAAVEDVYEADRTARFRAAEFLRAN